jgi:hypothetical protein
MPVAQIVEEEMRGIDPRNGPALCNKLAQRKVISIRKVGGVSRVFRRGGSDGIPKQGRPMTAIVAVRNSLSRVWDVAVLFNEPRSDEIRARSIQFLMQQEAITALEHGLLASGLPEGEILAVFDVLWPDMLARIRKLRPGFLEAPHKVPERRKRRPSGISVEDHVLSIIKDAGKVGVAAVDIRRVIGPSKRPVVSQALDWLETSGQITNLECRAPGRRMAKRWFAAGSEPRLDSSKNIILG